MKKEALLVGINKYPGFNSLQGCLNDIKNVRSILKSFFGFTNNEIRVLVDERATKNNILSRLEKMVEDARKGDFLVFHFSGHGSQIRDRNNDELSDHLDELICPYDMNWDNGFISDDMLRKILVRLRKGVSMEIILDSCHSGTGTRDLGPVSSQTSKGSVSYRFLRPPVDIESRMQGDEDKLGPARTFRSDPEIILNHVLWAACRDDQTSADALIDDTYNGAFSYYFCKHIRESAGRIRREDLCKQVRKSLNSNDFDQIPQLECPPGMNQGNIFINEPVKKMTLVK